MKKETAMKCFRKAGITSSDFSVVGRQYEDEDPFVDLDRQDELQSLVDQISHTDLEPPPQKITKYQDAIAVLEDVTVVMDSKGHSEDATKLSSTMNMLTKLHTVSLHHRQTTLQEFLQPSQK